MTDKAAVDDIYSLLSCSDVCHILEFLSVTRMCIRPVW